jgi:hypothetical protein
VKLRRYVLHLVLACLILMAMSAAIAEAETTICTPINQASIPFSINAPGVYCLTSDLVSFANSGNVITINTNNVVIDLNDHRIGGGGGGGGSATQAIGIYGNQHFNVTIRNGIIRGFYYGIKLEDTSGTTSYGNVVEGIRFDDNTYCALYVAGLGNRLRYNGVLHTGWSTATGIVDAYGIYSIGSSARVRDNFVSGTTEKAGGNSYAIYLASANDSMVEGNQVSNPALGPGTSNGIYVNSSNVIAKDNTIFNMTNGLFFVDGTGIYKNNFAVQVAVPFTGGQAASASETNYSNP